MEEECKDVCKGEVCTFCTKRCIRAGLGERAGLLGVGSWSWGGLVVLGLTQGIHVFGGRGLRETPRVSVHKQEKGPYGDVWWGYIRMGAEEDPLHVGGVQVWLGSRECSLEPKPELCMGCRMSWTWDT